MGAWGRIRQRLPRVEQAAPIIAAIAVILAAIGAGWWAHQPVPGEVERVGAVEHAGDAALPLPEPSALSNQTDHSSPAEKEITAPVVPTVSEYVAAPVPQTHRLPSPPATESNAPGPPAVAPTVLKPVATLTPPPLPRTDLPEQVRRFVAGFDGGECFFATPIKVNAEVTSIEVYAVSLPTAQALDKGFKDANGFEAQISFRPITPAQCPAVQFIGNLPFGSRTKPIVAIDDYVIRSGESLTGTVASTGGALSVLLVIHNGSVHNLSSTLLHQGATASFQVSASDPREGSAKPLLLIVIQSETPLTTLAAGPLPPADRTFPLIAEEARLSGQAVAATLLYLKLED